MDFLGAESPLIFKARIDAFRAEFELVINKKTAIALGLVIPHSLLLSAAKVIE